MWEPFWTSSTGHTRKETPGRICGGPAGEKAPVRRLSQERCIRSSSPIRSHLPPTALREFAFEDDGPVLDSRVRPSLAADVLEALGHVACQVARWQVVRSLVVSVAAGPRESPISHAPAQGSSSGWAGGLPALRAWMTSPESGKNNPTAAPLASKCRGTVPHLAAGNCGSSDVP